MAGSFVTVLVVLAALGTAAFMMAPLARHGVRHVPRLRPFAGQRGTTAEWRVRRRRLRGPGSGRRARRRVLRHRNGQSVAPQPRAHHFPPPARFSAPPPIPQLPLPRTPIDRASVCVPRPRSLRDREQEHRQATRRLEGRRKLLARCFSTTGARERPRLLPASWTEEIPAMVGHTRARGESDPPPFPTRTFLPLRTRLEQHSARPPFPSRPSCPFLLGTPQTLPPRVGTRSFRAHRSPSPPARHRCVRPFAFPPPVSCQALGVRTCGKSDGRFY